MFKSIAFEARFGPAASNPSPPGFPMLAHHGPWISILIAGMSLAVELIQLIPGL